MSGDLVHGRDGSTPAPDPAGLTLAEYAAARRRHPQAVRGEYLRQMRTGEGLELPAPTRCERQGETVKFCLPVGAASDHMESESVVIPMQSYRGSGWRTLCLSSQVGCRMACTFCETGRMGLAYNLTAAEIVRQRLAARRLMPADGPPPRPYAYHRDGIQNLVFMGMGEPLDNLDNVLQAIRVFNEPNGLAFPLAQITVSTVGRIDGLRRLAELARREEGGWRNLRLAISLNAATDEVRERLMPVNKAMPLAELQRELLAYPLAPRGRFLIEYVLLKGINDSLADADRVAQWCRPLPCVVNLIPYNPQRDAAYAAPDDDTVQGFLRRLRQLGIFVKRRVTYGRDLMGACGQLGNPAIRARRRAGTPAGGPLPAGSLASHNSGGAL